MNPLKLTVEERNILEQLTIPEIEFLSSLTTPGLYVFLTLGEFSEPEKSMILSLEREQYDWIVKFGFTNLHSLAKFEKQIRDKVLYNLESLEPADSFRILRMEGGLRILEKLSEFKIEERIVLRNFVERENLIIRNFSNAEDVDETLRNMPRLGKEDLKNFEIGWKEVGSLSGRERKILKRIDPQVFKLARNSSDEIQPIVEFRLDDKEEIALIQTNSRQRIILTWIHNLPPNCVVILFNLDFKRIRVIMVRFYMVVGGELELNRGEKYLWRKMKDLSPGRRHDIIFMTENDWTIFKESQNVLIDLSELGKNVLRAMTRFTEVQLKFVARTSTTGMGVLLGNDQLTPENLRSIMRVANAREEKFLVNLDSKTRAFVGNVEGDGEELLRKLSETVVIEKSLSKILTPEIEMSGDPVAFLKRHGKAKSVEILKTDLGKGFIRTGLSNGRVNLLKCFRSEIKDLIREDDYSIVRNLVGRLTSLRHAKSLATILHMLKEIDPNIPETTYGTALSELILKTRSLEFQETSCIDSRDIRILPEEVKDTLTDRLIMTILQKDVRVERFEMAKMNFIEAPEDPEIPPNLTTDHRIYWSMFWNNETTRSVEADVPPNLVLEEYTSRVFDMFQENYDTIGISLPRWVIGKTEYYSPRTSCTLQGITLPAKLVFDRKALVVDPLNQNTSFLPKRFRDYDLICGPSALTLEKKIVFLTDPFLTDEKCHERSVELHPRVFTERYRLPGTPDDSCQNMVLYGRDRSNRMILFVAQEYFYWTSSRWAGSVDLIFFGNDITFIDSRRERSRNHFLLKGDLSKCKIHKKGWNYFYVDAKEFVCDLDTEEVNVVAINGDFTDSRYVNSVIGNERKNKITIEFAEFVDGGGGRDVIIVTNSTVVKSHFGDLVIGRGVVFLPGTLDEIHGIGLESTSFVLWYETQPRIEVDKNCRLISTDGYSIVPIGTDTMRIRKKINNQKFDVVKYLFDPSVTDPQVFRMDSGECDYYWEGPKDTQNLYILDNLGSTVRIVGANGILDFKYFNITMEEIQFVRDEDFQIRCKSLHVKLLGDRRDVKFTLDGKKYYKLVYDRFQRDHCSRPLKVEGRISIDSTDLIGNYDCLDVQSNKVYFVRSNGDLILAWNHGTLYLNDYYRVIRDEVELALRLYDTMEPDEFWRRAGNPSRVKYYEIRKGPLTIYHNQPENKYDVGMMDLGEWDFWECEMMISGNDLMIRLGGNVEATVKNWRTNSEGREIFLSFRDERVFNMGCIVGRCEPDDVLHEFRGAKKVDNFGILLAIFQNWLDRNHPLPGLDRGKSSGEIFAVAYNATRRFEGILRRNGGEVDGIDFFDVYVNVAGFMREGKCSLAIDTFRSLAVSVGLSDQRLLDELDWGVGC